MRPFSPVVPREQSGLPFETWKEPWIPLHNLRGSPRYPSPFERNPEFHATTRKEPHFPHLIMKSAPILLPNSEESQLSASTSRGGLSSLLKPKRTVRFLLQVERTLTSPSIQEKASFPWKDSNGTPSIPWPHKGRSDSPVAALQKAKVPCVNSTGGLTPFFQFDWKVEF